MILYCKKEKIENHLMSKIKIGEKPFIKPF